MSSVQLDAATIQERLGLGEEHLPWLQELEALGAPPEPVQLPASEEALQILARANAPEDQVAEAVAAIAEIERDSALRWLVERCHHLLVQNMGQFDQMHSWPVLPERFGVSGRFVYVWAFLATIPAVRKYHQSRDIPDDIAWATLGDLGRNMGIQKRTYGVGGLGTTNWITLHFRGAIYELGRLQFNRSRVRYENEALEGLNVPFRHGDDALGVHIPESGPMTPEACAASFAAAPGFFARHFPEDSPRAMTCGSWLLDEQLADYLPADSNILRFQRCFNLLPGGRVCDPEIIWFVFRKRGKPVEELLDELPQRTSLERAIVQHLRGGGHWLARQGWIPI